GRMGHPSVIGIAFTLDCCDREAISWVATTGGIDSGDVRDLMIGSVEQRFGLVNRLSLPIESLSDNGSPYTPRDTRALAHAISLVPCTTPIESPRPLYLRAFPSHRLGRVLIAFRNEIYHTIDEPQTDP